MNVVLSLLLASSGVPAAGASPLPLAPKTMIQEGAVLPDSIPTKPKAAPPKASAPTPPAAPAATVAAPCSCAAAPGSCCGEAAGAACILPCPEPCAPCPCALPCYCGKSLLWFSGDYLLWWTKNNPAPPLVTTSTTPLGYYGPAPGSLADPNATVLFGGSDVSRQFRSGFRFNFGMWLTPAQGLGLEGGFLFLPRVGNSFVASSPDGSPALFRPFTNIATGAEVPAAELVAVPGFLSGGVRVDNDTCLWGAEANVPCRLCCTPWSRIVVLGGFRYLSLWDTLGISERAVVLQDFNGIPAGTSFALSDSFKTRNNFYGGQLGARGEFALGPFALDLLAKCALGSTVQTVDVNGTTIFNDGPPLSGGLLAQASNIGRHRQSRFAVVPEVGANLGLRLTDAVQFNVGYTLLYWSSVVRTGDQVDLRVNGSQLAGGAVAYNPDQPPKVPLKTTDFWAQGINFGMMFRF